MLLCKLIEQIRTALSDMTARLTRIERTLNQMAITQATMDADLATLQSDLTAGLSAVQSEIASLTAKASAGQDFTAEDTSIQSMISQLQTTVAGITPASSSSSSSSSNSSASAAPAPAATGATTATTA